MALSLSDYKDLSWYFYSIGLHGSPEDDVGSTARGLPRANREVRGSSLVVRQRRGHQFGARQQHSQLHGSESGVRERLGGAADGDPGEASGPAAWNPVVSRKRHGARNIYFRHSGEILLILVLFGQSQS